jgi:hypothetical protein
VVDDDTHYLINMKYILFPFWIFINYHVPLSENGTLISLLPSKDGLVIVADKRTNDRIRGDLDSANKIIQIGKFMAFSATGTPDFLSPVTFLPMYSAEKITSNFFESHGSLNRDSLVPLAVLLQNKFKDLLNSLQYFEWPLDGDPPDNALFQLGLYGYNAVANQFEVKYLRFCYKKQFPKPFIQVTYYEEDKEAFSNSKLMILGNTSVYNEIVQGNDNRFSDLRSDPRVKKFIFSKADIHKVSKKEAISFLKFLTKESSKRTSLIDSSPNHIGQIVDVAIIDKTKGFTWVDKNVIIR